MRTLRQFCLLVLMIGAIAVSGFADDIRDAIDSGRVDLVRTLIGQQPDLINSQDAAGLTPVNYAAFKGQLEVTKALVDLGADLTIGDNEGSLATHNAAVSGSVETVEYLLSRGVEVDVRDNFGMTALHFALSYRKPEVARLLIDRGADVDARNSRDWPPLLHAVIGGDSSMVALLLSKGADVNAQNNTGVAPLHSTASFARTAIAKMLLDRGAKPDIEDEDGQTPLFWTRNSNTVDVARLLIEKGADVNHRSNSNRTPLFACSQSGGIQVAELLLENGADINAVEDGGWSPITLAPQRSAEMVEFLILHGASVNPIPCTPSRDRTCPEYPLTALHIAAGHDNLDAVKALVSNGARVNIIGRNGTTPLHEAVMDGRTEIARYLLEHGAFTSARETNFGMTPLHVAAMKGYRDIVELLIAAGADVTARTDDGRTVADLAFYHGFDRIAYTCLAAGAPADSVEQYMNAPTALAAQVQSGEATIWHLGHSGWAIKTANNLLIFDYNMNDDMSIPEDASLAAGFINLEEIRDYNVTVFCSHHHGDHYYPGIYSWRDSIPNMQIVLGWRPQGVTEPYTFIGPRSETTVNDMNVSTIWSTDAGVGFVVEVDGLTIFHAGDHANGDVDNMAPFTDEIDYIAERQTNIDLAFMGIRGCSLGDPESVKAGVYYAVDKLKPKFTFPMHAGSNTQSYREFAETAATNGIAAKFVCAMCGGHRFTYRSGDIQSLLADNQ